MWTQTFLLRMGLPLRTFAIVTWLMLQSFGHWLITPEPWSLIFIKHSFLYLHQESTFYQDRPANTCPRVGSYDTLMMHWKLAITCFLGRCFPTSPPYSEMIPRDASSVHHKFDIGSVKTPRSVIKEAWMWQLWLRRIFHGIMKKEFGVRKISLHRCFVVGHLDNHKKS